MKKTLQLASLLLGALALSITLATAEGKCGDGQKEMKCQSSKCSTGKDVEKCASGKCSGDKNMTKEVPKKGKCGQGKCG